MLRGLQCLFVLSSFLAACAGSDGHPPVVDELPDNGEGGSDVGPTGPVTGTAGKGNAPANSNLYEGGFINIPQVSDIALDEPRGVLYVSTTDGGLAIVDLASGKISSQELGEGGLTGMDLSPDGNLLAVGEHSTDADAEEFWVHLVDLQAGTVREIRLPLTHGHLIDGSQSVAFADNESLLVSASWAAYGYTPMFRVNLADDSSVAFGVAWSDAMFQRSADGSVVDYIEPFDLKGPMGRYDVASQLVTLGEAGVALQDLSLNADGSLVGLPTRGQFTMKEPSADGFSAVGTIFKENRDAMASVFSPVQDSVYVAWSKNLSDGKAGLIERYTADATLEAEGLVSASVPLATKRESGYAPARMKISSDGTLLFLTVEAGINVYAVEP